MAEQNSVKQNIVYNSVYNVLIIIIPLVLSPYVSRALGVEGIGLYSFTYTVANYFKRFSMLGMEKYGNRSIAFVKEKKETRNSTFWGIYKVQFLCCIVCFAIYTFYLLTIDTRGLPSILQSIFILSSFFDVSWYFFGNERFKPVIVVSAACKLIYLGLTFLLVNDRTDVNTYITLTALSYLIPHLIIFLLAIKEERYTHNSSAELFDNIKGTLVLFIPVIAVTIYKSMDKVMLGVLCNTSYENGLYENAEKILHVPIAVISAVSSVLMPRMTRLYRDKENSQAGSLIHSTMKYAAFIAIASACGLAGISTIFSNVYWGKEFAGCAALLRMFSISIPFMSYAEIIRTQYIIPNHQDNTYIFAVTIGAIVNTIINALLIPRMGARGAVIGTVIAEASVCVFQAYKVRKYLPVLKYCQAFIKYLPAGLTMAFLVFFISNNTKHSAVSLMLIIIVGALIFCALSILQVFLTERASLSGLKTRIIEFIQKDK